MKEKTSHSYPNKYCYMFLTWVLQYAFTMRELLNKDGLNWGEQDHLQCYFLFLNMHACAEELQLNAKIRIMTLFSLGKLLSFSMTLVISNSIESISSYSPKMVKLSLDVNFGLTSWLSDLKISSSSSSIFSWYVSLWFCSRSTFYFFLSVHDLIFVDVTATLWGERSLSDSPSDWLKFKLFWTSVISSLSSSDTSPTFDLVDLGLA